MSERGFSAREDLPLIGVIAEDGEQVVHYFVPGEEEERDPAGNVVRDVRTLAGVWSDLDWQQMVEELDSIRHSAPPSPPLDL